MQRTIIIAAGGTGGHLFPAQALAKQISTDLHPVFMSAGLSDNQFFQKETYTFYDIPSATIFHKNFFMLLKAGGTLLRGVWKSLRILRKERPQFILGFGSFHSFPVLLAGKLLGIPFALYESNVRAGKVNRFLSKWARFSAVQFETDQIGLKGRIIPVKMPTQVMTHLEDPYEYFQVEKKKCVVLVFGGSRGACSINELTLEMLPKLQEAQVIHILGRGQNLENVKKQYRDCGIKACIKAFEPKMFLAWTIADFCISRAGAMTLSEQIQFEVPSILIPYPYATENHQDFNADFMEKVVKGSYHLRSVTLKTLTQSVQKFLDNPKVLEEKRSAISLFKNSRIRQDLTRVILMEVQ